MTISDNPNVIKFHFVMLSIANRLTIFRNQVIGRSRKFNQISVLKQFVKDEIVKDVIDEAPSQLLKVTYSPDLSVDGKELTPTQVQNQPKVEWNGEKGSFYTVLLTDPDAPSRTDPKWKEVRHWLVANIPGSDLNAGETLIDYLGSAPPSDSGIHRYVFLLSKQTKGKHDFKHPHIGKFKLDGRLSKKSTRQLITDHNLKLIAGNFYYAQYDDLVPSLHAQFV